MQYDNQDPRRRTIRRFDQANDPNYSPNTPPDDSDDFVENEDEFQWNREEANIAGIEWQDINRNQRKQRIGYISPSFDSGYQNQGPNRIQSRTFDRQQQDNRRMSPGGGQPSQPTFRRADYPGNGPQRSDNYSRGNYQPRQQGGDYQPRQQGGDYQLRQRTDQQPPLQQRQRYDEQPPMQRQRYDEQPPIQRQRYDEQRPAGGYGNQIRPAAGGAQRPYREAPGGYQQQDGGYRQQRQNPEGQYRSQGMRYQQQGPQLREQRQQGSQASYGIRQREDNNVTFRHRTAPAPSTAIRDRGAITAPARDTYRFRDNGPQQRRPGMGGGYGYQQKDRFDKRGKPGTLSTSKKPKKKKIRETTLPRALGRLQFGSRRFALEMVNQGRVKVSEIQAKNEHQRIAFTRDFVRVDNLRLRKQKPYSYIVYFKPGGIISSREFAKRNMHSNIPYTDRWYVPFGRLTRSSSGLIILTNDPRFRKSQENYQGNFDKEYTLKLNVALKAKDVTKILKDFQALDGGQKRAQLEVISTRKKGTACSVKLVIWEGSVSDIYKIFKEHSIEVLTLTRHRVGCITSDMITTSTWRRLSAKEIQWFHGGEKPEALFFDETEESDLPKEADLARAEELLARRDSQEGGRQRQGSFYENRQYADDYDAADFDDDDDDGDFAVDELDEHHRDDSFIYIDEEEYAARKARRASAPPAVSTVSAPFSIPAQQPAPPVSDDVEEEPVTDSATEDVVESVEPEVEDVVEEKPKRVRKTPAAKSPKTTTTRAKKKVVVEEDTDDEF